VRCDMLEEKAVATLLEWVESVQQEVPGAVIGVVWTHTDWFVDCMCGGGNQLEGFLCVTGTDRNATRWIPMQYLQRQHHVH